MKKITKEEVADIKEVYRKASAFEQKIDERLFYIIHTASKLCGIKNKGWFDYNNGGGEVDGHFQLSMLDDEYFQFDGGDWKNDCEYIDKNGTESDIFCCLSFPTRWFFEDFEDELKDGIEKFKIAKQEKKKKAAEAYEKSKRNKEKKEIEAAKALLRKHGELK